MKNFIFLAILILAICPTLQAVDIFVVNGNNDGAGSFRDAVDQAVDGDQILFNIGQVVLQEPVEIDDDIIITGPVTLNGANKTNILDILGVDVDIDNVRFINGNSAQGGGAIKAEGGTVLTITNCQFINNKAIKAGGAIDLESNADIDLLQDTLFQNNQSNLTGGAINLEGGADIILIDNCKFIANKTLFSDPNDAHPNSGGAIAIEFNGEITTIQDTLFQQNQTSGIGGAIENVSDNNDALGIGQIIRCKFIANVAKTQGGAIANLGVEEVGTGDNRDGTIGTITDCEFTNNLAQQDSGGAIFNNGDIDLIERSLFFNNTSNFEGGGLFNDASDNNGNNTRDVASIENCTFSNNLARRFGGGIFDKGGNLSFDSCTIAFNNALIAGGGIAIDQNDSVVVLVNTIVAQNIAPTNRDVSGINFDTGNNNLIGDGGNSNFVDGADGNIVGNAQGRINPLFGALVNNGGETKTRAIAANSPARDVGLTDLDEDQRAFGRPDPINNLDDIGAFEFGAVEDVRDLAIVNHQEPQDDNTEPQLDENRQTDDVQFVFSKGAGVTILWQEDKDEIVAFNILRKDQDKEDFTKVNALLIMATPNKKYDFHDKDVSPGKRYFYRFQLISKNGDSKLTKPYKTTIPTDN